MDTPRFPVEAVRNMYVAPFGGFSSELAAGEVGLSRNALEANTSLAGGEDRVVVTTDGGARATPFFAKPFFRVVPLDDARPNALANSPEGEVVFSEADFGGSTYSVFDVLRDGAMVVLNATMAKRFPWMEAAESGLIARPTFDPRFPGFDPRELV